MTRFRTVFCSVLILNIVYKILPLHADNAVPVLLWGGSVKSDLSRSAVNPFLKTTSEEFDLFLRKLLENSPPVLLYMKENLCTEDLVKHKQHLQKVATGDSLHYFSAVEKAVNTIEDLPMYNQTYNDYVDVVPDGQLLIVPINNLDIIPETYKAVKDSNPNSIAVLTGKSCSYRRSERVKRDANEDASTKPFKIASNRVLLYSSQPLVIKPGEKESEIHLGFKPTVTDEPGVKKSSYNLILQFHGTDENIIKHKLVFIFEVKTSGYYTLKTVNYTYFTHANTPTNEQSLVTDTNIVFPFNFSYHCSQNIIFKNSGTILNITDLQVQFDAKQGKNNNTKIFADAYDCVGFTTIPIWTGVFVTAILGLIMIWGLSMIIDIRTMDRFDDPKGKTITIAAQE
ncbi:V-type proton ATPase subunit S1 [Xylocopa sonorina]|uniref:V-type proton ATPase subunit S1 n=1 Tax=Xylocopa sonorina TaxID=1818115 RepID=UPI00403AC460